MPLDILIGAQWGDEGKGRMVDLLSAQADYVARYNGGDNAGHTVTTGERTFKLHLLPSGMIHPRTVGILGSGLVINPATLLAEMNTLQAAGLDVSPLRLRISHAAHVITPAHTALDRAREQARGSSKIGTTLRGIGPAYTHKAARTGIRMEAMLDLDAFRAALRSQIEETNLQLTQIYHAEALDSKSILDTYVEYAKQLAPYITDTSLTLHSVLSGGANVLAEGAQGTLLDIDYGTYPYVTSSSPTAPGALTGLGVGHKWVRRVIGIAKVFQTRVGEGPFPSEVEGDLAQRLRGSGENPWDEYGTTTGRPRRVGWLDMVLLRYAARINGITELCLTKMDILSGFDNLSICNAYRKESVVYPELPLGPAALAGYEPVYDVLPGWKGNISAARQWRDLPKAAHAYVTYVKKHSGLPITLVSVGPEREQIVQVEGV